MVENRKNTMRKIGVVILMLMVNMAAISMTAFAAGKIKVSYYYEEVCASCDGTKDFFELYNRVISAEDKKQFSAEIATYNVFMDSCKEQYEKEKEALGIPAGISLPVLVVGEQWISGHDNMEAQMREVLLTAEPVDTEESAVLASERNDDQEITESAEGHAVNPEFWEGLRSDIEKAEPPVALLFSTNHCDDCSVVKQWFSDHELSLQIVEYNIIEKECLNELKMLFRQYQIPEDKQKVPVVFIGENYYIGKEEISNLEKDFAGAKADNKMLLEMTEKAEYVQNGSTSGQDDMNLLTLGAAGLLAGFNPCSISMLLMLMSLLLSEKASIWKSGLLYLAGKYVAYISIGFVIFVTASQISDQTMETVGNAMNLVMGILFAVAAVLYMIDAVRVYRQDYGNIKMQLPVGLRRINHNLIKKASSVGGMMQPFMILVLGIVISFGEFFCTGQIYMASITYMLKDQMKAAVLPFLVYTTAMSIPAVIMILLIQRTRNTEAVSDFMFRHLGMIKIFNAVLFALFAIYFLIS